METESNIATTQKQNEERPPISKRHGALHIGSRIDMVAEDEKKEPVGCRTDFNVSAATLRTLPLRKRVVHDLHQQLQRLAAM
jgi:hypothetical protein